jgi:prepilin peptidase CpaA
MFVAIAMLVAVLLAVATVCDLRSREIPDWISIAIGTIAIATSLIGWLGLTMPWVIAGGIAGLCVGYLLFCFARLGGGDAKLIAALGLLVGPIGLPIVLFGMAIGGGVLSLIALRRGQRDFAYGPAITAGFLGYVGFVSQF